MIIETILIMSSNTGWKWQWCTVRQGTLGIIKSLSPKFDTEKQAIQWATANIRKQN